MKKSILVATIILVVSTSVSANEATAVTACNDAIKDNFHSSVQIEFPNPIIKANANAYFVHYKDGSKLITGGGTNRVDARCTVWKDSNEVVGLTVAGKSKK